MGENKETGLSSKPKLQFLKVVEIYLPALEITKFGFQIV